MNNRQGAAHVSTQRERAGGGSAVSLALRLLSVGPLLILILLVAAISQLTPDFLKPVNIGNILSQTAVIAIVAIGQQLGHPDPRHRPLGRRQSRARDRDRRAGFSQPTIPRCSSGWRCWRPPRLSARSTGVVFVYGRLPHPFIITLATLSICRGLALELVDRPHHDARNARLDLHARRLGNLRRAELLLRRAWRSRSRRSS